MEHLRSKFHEALGAEANLQVHDGQVYIRGRNWAPEDVLKAVSPEGYDDIFQEWIEDRKQEFIGRADAFLAEYDQVDRFRSLKAAFGRGAVFPFVGAGLSQPSGYLGWTEFLRRVRRQTAIPEEAFEELLRNGEYEEAAQQLHDALGVQFDEEVENTYGLDKPLYGPIQLLPTAFPMAAFTTNFDNVLKRSYENSGRQFSDTITGPELVELPRLIGANQPVLVKLHGKATSGRGRVLTRSEYDNAYTLQSPLRRSVECMCGRTLLFLGCSLSFDRLVSEIAALVETQGHQNCSRHYAFIPYSEDEAIRQGRKAELAKCNIYPIWYPTDEHDDSIEALLYKLLEESPP